MVSRIPTPKPLITHLAAAYYPSSIDVMSVDLPPEGPILISACLAGRACRFDGTGALEDEVAKLVAEGRAVLVCPEVDGGLGTPRPAAEIQGGDGSDVIAGRARVVATTGDDVTANYLRGAEQALAMARRTGARAAILKARSPSCGKGAVYDGSFSGTLQTGDGVTAALLRSEGIAVFTDEEVTALPEE